MPCLALGADDDGCRAGRDASIERRVERALEGHLAQAWLEHAQRLEDVGDAAHARPRSHTRRDRIAEAEHVDDVGSLHPLEGRGQRRRDPHPPVADRRREVRDADVVQPFDSRTCSRPGVQVDERCRHHLDVVPACGEPLAELARHRDRAAEGDGRPPRRRGEQDS
jgi:hypothetical protein